MSPAIPSLFHRLCQGILPALLLGAFALQAHAAPAISGGGMHSLSLKTDGSVWATGYNNSGQLGDGTTTSRSTPVQVMTGVQAISAGGYHSLFLKTDGSVWATGSNYNGQFGDGTTTTRSTPVQVMTGVQAISAGGDHSLFLKTDGSVWATGANGSGQLGNGTTTTRSTPVQVMTGVQAIAAGGDHSLFLKTDGNVWATGSNGQGRLGDGTTTGRSTPVQVITGVQAIEAGSNHSLFLKTGGSVWAAGYNSSGQLGDGTTTDRHSPVQVMTGAQAISAGDYHSLFLKTDGSVLATRSNGATPEQVMTGVQAISAGSEHSLFLRIDGSVWASGSNYSGQLGDGTTTNRSTPVQVFQLILVPAIALEAPPGTPVNNGAGTLAYGYIAPGHTKDLSVTVRNIGNADLTAIAASITGTGAGQFSLVPTPPVTLAVGGAAEFIVRFSPTTPGVKSATLSIASNDPNDNPFTLTLSGTVLGNTTDTDGDGLNDLAEYLMSSLGFNWQVNQAALVNTYYTNANTANLYTTSQVQGLNVGVPLLSKDPGTGKFKLTIGVQKSPDLIAPFLAFPMNGAGAATSINAAGKLEFEFTSPDNAAFFRIESK